MAKAEIIDYLLCIFQVDQIVNLEHAKISEVTQVVVEITLLFLQCRIHKIVVTYIVINRGHRLMDLMVWVGFYVHRIHMHTRTKSCVGFYVHRIHTCYQRPKSSAYHNTVYIICTIYISLQKQKGYFKHDLGCFSCHIEARLLTQVWQFAFRSFCWFSWPPSLLSRHEN